MVGMIESAEEFHRLLHSEVASERRRAACDEASEIVWRDVMDRYPDLCPWVAHNKPVPITILRVLADNSDVEVRNAVAMRRKLDLGLFRKLAADSEYAIRGKIVQNPKVPLEVLRVLAEDTDEWVRSVAAQKLAERIGEPGDEGRSPNSGGEPGVRR
jgi:hypothetical protein